MKYQGFEGEAEFDHESGVWIGRVTNCLGTVVFMAETEGDIPQQFREAVDEYLDFAKEKGFAAYPVVR